MEIAERIEAIAKHQRLSVSAFADQIGVQRSSMSHILTGRNKPSLEFVQKVLQKYPFVQPDWLLFGKGSMTKELKQGTLFDNENCSLHTEDKLDKEEESKPEIFKEEPKAESLIGKLNASPIGQNREKKEIEQIVVFYKDGTFRTYVESLLE
jgi:transcriptional regulator with XRE-family HTH domain